MKNICKNITKKINGLVICKKYNTKVDFTKCTDCSFYETKRTKSTKLATLEKNRYSIIVDDLETCYLCKNYAQSLHEVFGGKNRKKSMEYGLVIPLCIKCHRYVEDNEDIKLKLKKEAQTIFINKFKDTDFIKEFGQNYIQRRS